MGDLASGGKWMAPWITIIRERIAEINVLLMFGPFPPPWTGLSEELSRERAILKALLERGRKMRRRAS